MVVCLCLYNIKDDSKEITFKLYEDAIKTMRVQALTPRPHTITLWFSTHFHSEDNNLEELWYWYGRVVERFTASLICTLRMSPTVPMRGIRTIAGGYLPFTRENQDIVYKDFVNNMRK